MAPQTEERPIAVLVVEDGALVRMSAVDIVEEAGFVALEAANADQAIALIEEGSHNIRVVFMDIDMPGSMDGLRLARAVRDRWPPIQIIVASGYRVPAEDDLPSEAEFFAKPYDHRNIIKAMLRLAT